jgi:glycosyltransferase involved in cell wall biosynthesis
MVSDSLRARNKSLLVLTPYPEASASDRYRVYQYLPHLKADGWTVNVRPFATPSMFSAIQTGKAWRIAPHLLPRTVLRLLDIVRAGRYDLVLVHREAFPFFTPLLERLVAAVNPRVIYGFDDALYHRPKDRRGVLYRLKYGGNIAPTIRLARHVLAGSEELAAYARTYSSQVTTVPTVVDTNQYSPPRREEKQTCTIGWVGSRSTAPYLSAIRSPLARLLNENSALRIKLVGAPDDCLALGAQVERHPFRLEQEIADIASFDIGVMPLPDDPWTRGKCAFKAIQYLALGIPCVTSPVGMATEVVSDGQNGFWARTEAEWYEALRALIDDRDMRIRLGNRGRRDVEERFSLDKWAPIVAEILRDVADAPRRSGTLL